jgi:hypothetical protein
MNVTLPHQAATVTALSAYLARRKPMPACPLLVGDNSLNQLLHRYPFLFKTLCLAKGKTAVEQIDRLQQASQKRFEVSLSRHIIAQLQGQKSPIKAPNPTRLNRYGLGIALSRFTGQTWGRETHRNLADRFLAQAKQESFAAFKQNLHSYLMASVCQGHGAQNFDRELRHALNTFLPDQNNQPLNTFLLTATCRHLFKFLVVENSSNLSHTRLLGLVHNFNPFTVAELLTRLLLLCPRSQCHLDKRLALLFRHYSPQPQTDVNWLVQLLEYMNLAYATQFGHLRLPSIASPSPQPLWVAAGL